jgi:hypothetical protein
MLANPCVILIVAACTALGRTTITARSMGATAAFMKDLRKVSPRKVRSLARYVKLECTVEIRGPTGSAHAPVQASVQGPLP